MSESRSRSSEVEVPVDPLTAFNAFTQELDLWWVRGPINSYGAGKLLAMRMEPRIGGRLLEVYDTDSGEGLELARITAWEPGSHLAWQSSLDDVTIDVRFDSSDIGTRVRLEATIPDGGADRGGTAFIRVTPRWFGAWIAKRDTTPTSSTTLPASPSLCITRDPSLPLAGWPRPSASSHRVPCPRERIRSPATMGIRGSSFTSATARS